MIDVIRLEKTYKGITLKFGAMRFTRGLTLIKGANGSGKTTLLKGLAGLLPIAGQMTVKGRVAYLPENRSLPFWVSPQAYLETLAKIEKPILPVKRWVRAFDLHDKRHEPLGSLSNGMRQKVHLISVLMLDREIYLLDEPFNALDQKTVTALLHHLKARNRVVVCACHQTFPGVDDVRVIEL